MPKKSLMLAGGGVKVAFQAGVLQVWLDEAGLEFDRADAVSAACFNLAMWVQGMSGTQIADNWRNTQPFAEVDVNGAQLARLLYAASILDLDAFRRNIFPAWKIDFSAIRSSPRSATFNVYNFSRHELVAVRPADMTEDLLISTASLPMWFPPVKIGGDTYVDAIFNVATNIDEAIRCGADELWVIWTTSQRGEWFDGFVGNFFGIFEATVVGSYRNALARIAGSNAAIERGEPGEFGRVITVRELKAEVPVHYLLNFSRDRAAEAVNRGVEAARDWCDAAGIARRPGPVYVPARASEPVKLFYSETLSGFVDFGTVRPGGLEFKDADFEAAFERGQVQNTSIELRADVEIEDLDAFLDLPEHRAKVQGVVECEHLGGKLLVESGALQFFIDSGDLTRKQIRYEISFRSLNGDVVVLAAAKNLTDQPGTAHELSNTRITLEGGKTHAAGIVRSSLLHHLEQLASMRVEAPTVTLRARALARFGAFYFGRLWDVYARHLLPVAPF